MIPTSLYSLDSILNLPSISSLLLGNHGRRRKQGSDQAVRYLSPTSSADHRIREGEHFSSDHTSECSNLTFRFSLSFELSSENSRAAFLRSVSSSATKVGSRFDSFFGLEAELIVFRLSTPVGHRLKSKDAKTSKMFDVLSTKKSESDFSSVSSPPSLTSRSPLIMQGSSFLELLFKMISGSSGLW